MLFRSLLPFTVEAQSCPAAPTALVLAGGGAKGFAHIGVIQILDSLGLRPDLVVGTSSGAIAGALKAKRQHLLELGLTPDEVIQVTRTKRRKKKRQE